MKSNYLIGGAIAMLALSVAGVAASQSARGATSATTASPELSDGELEKRGEESIKQICTECHSFDDIVVTRRTPKEWNDVVAVMATKGAIATQEQSSVIRQYLMRYYGLVAVNTAAATDLSAVLGLTAKEASAVVEYRLSHGKFTGLAGLLKVPGVSRDKLEADPDALTFD